MGSKKATHVVGRGGDVREFGEDREFGEFRKIGRVKSLGKIRSLRKLRALINKSILGVMASFS